MHPDDTATLLDEGGVVIDQSGDEVGKIGQVYLDDANGNPEWVTVKTGLFGGSETFIPIRDASASGTEVTVPYTKDKIKDAPRMDDGDGHLSPEQEQELYRYYGLSVSETDTRSAVGDVDRTTDTSHTDEVATPHIKDRGVGDDGHDTSGHDFGPIPVSRMKTDAAQIFAALGQGRRVLVSRRGEVVAAIDPADAIDTRLLADYSLPGRRHLAELSATEINRGSPSRAVADAAHGGLARYVTKDNRVYGMLRPVTGAELAAELPSPQEAADLGRRVEEHLRAHPEATAEELVSLTQDRGVSSREDAPDAAHPTGTPAAFAAGGAHARQDGEPAAAARRRRDDANV